MRIAMELQEKLERKEKVLKTNGFQEREDLVSALVNLGFKRREIELTVEETIKNADAGQNFETLLRKSLKRLAKI
jgi:Holliday junction DNA helicase RuvA